MKDYVIIVAGGKGLRMGSDIPKQFLPIGGKPVLMRTIERFREYSADLQIILVLPKGQQAYWKQLCHEYDFRVDYLLADGGETRFHSVQNGLALIPDDATGVVSVHDGVRPFPAIDVIGRCYETARAAGTAIPVIPVVETLRHLSGIGQERTNFDGIGQNGLTRTAGAGQDGQTQTEENSPCLSVQSDAKNSPYQSVQSDAKDSPCQSVQSDAKDSPCQSVQSDAKDSPYQSVQSDAENSPCQSVQSDAKNSPYQSVQSDAKTSPCQSVQSDAENSPCQSVQSDAKNSPCQSVQSDAKNSPCLSVQSDAKNSPCLSVQSDAKNSPCLSVQSDAKNSPCLSVQSDAEKESVTVPRGDYRLVQTPQAFDIQLLKAANRQPYSDAFTDDASVVEAFGHPITLVEGNRENIKLTTPYDLKIAEVLI